jgi:hypothetical protein
LKDVTKMALTTNTRPPRAVLEIKDHEDQEEGVKRQISLNQNALPGGGEDDMLLQLAKQIIDATKINQHEASDATERINAAIAALHDIAPVGVLEGMLAAQLVATHMATMDCYQRLTTTNDRDIHGYNLNQANKLSRTYVSLLEALNRHRGKGQQKVTVEHVHVHQGGQAIVGHVENQGGGVQQKTNGSTPCVNG